MYIYIYISYHIILYVSYRVVSCRVISYHIISYHKHRYHIISHRIVSYRIVSCRVISYHITSHHIKSYHIISIYHMHMILYLFFASPPLGLSLGSSLLRVPRGAAQSASPAPVACRRQSLGVREVSSPLDPRQTFTSCSLAPGTLPGIAPCLVSEIRSPEKPDSCMFCMS